MNKYLSTVIIAPMTTVIRDYPTRIKLTFDQKQGQIVLDQIRAVDRNRLIRKIGNLDEDISNQVVELMITSRIITVLSIECISIVPLID